MENPETIGIFIVFARICGLSRTTVYKYLKLLE